MDLSPKPSLEWIDVKEDADLAELLFNLLTNLKKTLADRGRGGVTLNLQDDLAQELHLHAGNSRGIGTKDTLCKDLTQKLGQEDSSTVYLGLI